MHGFNPLFGSLLGPPHSGFLYHSAELGFGKTTFTASTTIRSKYSTFRDTRKILAALTAIAPEGRTFCGEFDEIIQAGTGREFAMEDNEHWVERTAPIVQAFFHARYFLEMAVKYADVLTEPPQTMPSGWAALLCLYRLR